jgi:hypothetical protein
MLKQYPVHRSVQLISFWSENSSTVARLLWIKKKQIIRQLDSPIYASVIFFLQVIQLYLYYTMLPFVLDFFYARETKIMAICL